MLAGALEALYKELPRGTTVGQNGRTYRDPAVVEDGDSVFSQEDRPPGVKKQPEGTEAYTSFTKYKPTPGQLFRTPSVKTTAIQADLL